MNTIGDRIAYVRELRNLKQKELANLIGVTNATMCKYENNINIPNSDILYKLAETLHTSADYLIGRTNRMEPLISQNNYYSYENLIRIISKLNDENKIKLFERAITLLEQQ